MQSVNEVFRLDKQDSDPALIARGYASLVESWRRLAQLVPTSVIEEGEGYTLITRRNRQPFFNTLFLTRVPTDLGVLLAHAQTFFSAHQQAHWSVQGMGAVAEALAPEAAAFGLVHSDTEPAMLLTPLVYRPPVQSELVIRPVETIEQVEVFDEIIFTCFDLPRDAPRAKATPADYQKAKLALYLGFVEDAPVVTALRSTAYGVAMIHAICTLPAYRRRGFGEAITWRAALDGIAEGCAASFLTASPLGRAVYARMGYRDCGEVHIWNTQATDG